jgi:hypothetical protein
LRICLRGRAKKSPFLGYRAADFMLKMLPSGFSHA